jgi:RecA/RadA recombinase
MKKVVKKKVTKKKMKNGNDLSLIQKLVSGVKDLSSLCDMEEEIFVPTIFTSYNRATGIGGHPLRRVIMVHGQEGTGKSVFVLGIAESLRRLGHISVIFDPEHAAEKRWYNELAFGRGIMFKMPEDFDTLINDVQIMLNNLKVLKEKKEIEQHVGYCFVVDTITKLIPREAYEKMQEEGVKRGYAIAAMWTSLWFKSLIPQLFRSNSTLLVITQERENMDKKGPYDLKAKPGGGAALRYDSSLRVRFTGKAKVKEGETVVGQRNNFTVEKNKVDGLEYAKGSFFTSNGNGSVPVGIDFVREAIEEAKLRKSLIRKDSIMKINLGEYHFQLKGGWETLRRHFTENEDEFTEFVDALNEDARR